MDIKAVRKWLEEQVADEKTTDADRWSCSSALRCLASAGEGLRRQIGEFEPEPDAEEPKPKVSRFGSKT